MTKALFKTFDLKTSVHFKKLFQKLPPRAATGLPLLIDPFLLSGGPARTQQTRKEARSGL
jgi:hypothetical protein